MFCPKCGKKNEIRKSDWNTDYYQWMEVCPGDHKVYCGTNPSEEYRKQSGLGLKPVRTTTSDGYQTSWIPQDFDETKFKDRNFHAVSILGGFLKMRS